MITILRKKRNQCSLTVRASGDASVRLYHGEPRDGNIAKVLCALAEQISTLQTLRGTLQYPRDPSRWYISMYTNNKQSHRSFAYVDDQWVEQQH